MSRHPYDDAPGSPDDVVHMDFEEPNYGGRTASESSESKPKDDKPKGVPKPPKRELALTGDEVKRGISERARAAASLKVEGLSYAEIADLMEYETVADAKRAVDSALASLHGPEDLETLRIIAATRAEQQFKRSTQMASATHLELPDGEQVENVDRLRWHQVAQVDLMNWATIVGAKAAAKVEVTASDEQVDRLVAEYIRRTGGEQVLDAEVIELEVIEAPVDDIGDPDA